MPVVADKSGGGVDVAQGARRLPYPVEEYQQNNANLQAAIQQLDAEQRTATARATRWVRAYGGTANPITTDRYETKRIYRMILPFAALLLAAVSCSDWTETEAIENTVYKPWEQDPALWADYTAALRAYKQSEHYLSYARLNNSPAQAASEQDFMRCLPDSLDIVTLTNADNFSTYDAEDMAVMREKGTRVLYQVDYAARKAEFSGEAALKAYLDGVIASVAANGLDGYSFTTDPLDAAATASIVATLSAAKTDGQLLVFEGNPLSVAAADREKLDYVFSTPRRPRTPPRCTCRSSTPRTTRASPRIGCCWPPRSTRRCRTPTARSTPPWS